MKHPDSSLDFFSTIKTVYGNMGQQWIDSLDERIAICTQQWQLRDVVVGKHLSYHYIISAHRITDDTPVILKLGIDQQTLEQEQRALEFYKGNGCVRILAADTQQQALLLEHLIPGTSLMSLFSHNDTQAMHITATILQQLHTARLPEHHQLPTLARMLTTLDQPIAGMPEHHLTKAQRLAHELLKIQVAPVVLHGDLHHGNILKTVDTWRAIDPKGIVGDPVYDVVAFVRNPLQQLIEREDACDILRKRIKTFSQLIHVDYERIASWCYVQSILSVYWHIEDKADAHTVDDALRMAELIEHVYTV